MRSRPASCFSDAPNGGKMIGIENGQRVMNERICVRCRHFSPARTCMEKPTWGHCMWSVPEGKDETERQGRFAWAEAVCEHFASRRTATAPG